MKAILIYGFSAYVLGLSIGMFIWKDPPQTVKMTRTLIELAEDACKSHRGAETFTKEMEFVCVDGTKISIK